MPQCAQRIIWRPPLFTELHMSSLKKAECSEQDNTQGLVVPNAVVCGGKFTATESPWFRLGPLTVNHMITFPAKACFTGCLQLNNNHLVTIWFHKCGKSILRICSIVPKNAIFESVSQKVTLQYHGLLIYSTGSMLQRG